MGVGQGNCAVFHTVCPPLLTTQSVSLARYVFMEVFYELLGVGFKYEYCNNEQKSAACLFIETQ